MAIIHLKMICLIADVDDMIGTYPSHMHVRWWFEFPITSALASRRKILVVIYIFIVIVADIVRFCAGVAREVSRSFVVFLTIVLMI